MKARNPIRVVLGAVLLLVAIGFAVLWVAQTLNDPAETIPADGAVFTVEKGENVNAISSHLAEQGLIRSPLFLKLLSYIRGSQGSFQVGSYLVEPDTTTWGIHDLLVSGRELLVRVTIPEGWSLSRIAERLQKKEIVAADEFISAATNRELLDRLNIPGRSAEGFLFPDTYLFPRSFPAERVVGAMVDTFFDTLASLYPDYAGMDPADLYRKVVLASIIEREYRASDEAPLMASVFYNRLEANMRLQSCATVAYVITEKLGLPYPTSLTYADLELPSAYNTYLNAGLPPGPISNPGVTALDAALHPAETDYLFFVLKDPDAGRHEFTRSFGEHLVAKNLYLKKS